MKAVWNKGKVLFTENFADYKMTLILLGCWVIAGIADYTSERSYEYGLTGFLLFFTVFAMSTFLLELWLKEKPVKKGILLVITGIIAFVLSVIIHENMLILMLNVPYKASFLQVLREPSLSESWVLYYLMVYADEYLTGYLLLLFILIFYGGYRRSKETLAEYINRTFFNLGIVLASYLILMIGSVFLWAAVEALLLSEPANDVEGMIGIIITGFFLAPGCMWAVTDRKRFLKITTQGVVFSYLVTAFSIGIMAVGYLYMLRILLRGHLPSNEVFTFMTVLFVLSLPEWLTMEAYKEHPIYRKILAKLPYVFAPLIGLQIYSLAVRISDYGLTPGRYAGIMLILFELFVVVLWRVKRSRLDLIFPLMAVMVLVSVFAPFLNMRGMSARSQEAFLKEYGPRLQAGEELEKLEFSRLDGAFKYLHNRPDVRNFDEKYGYLEGLLEEGQESGKRVTYSVHGCQMVGDLDTTGYRKLHMMNQSESYDNILYDDGEKIDFSNFKLYIRETGEEVSVDLSKIYEEAIAYDRENPGGSSEDDTAYLRQYNRIEVDENRIFYVNHFRIYYFVEYQNEEETIRIRDVEISGMLLEK